jgi:hypothetical protein
MTPERMRQYGRGLGLWQDKTLAVGEPISYLRGDDKGSVTLSEAAKGYWLEEDKICEKPSDLLANGVFLWTETQGTGHAFVSIHKEWSIHVYTYGRFGDTSFSPVGDGVLIQYSFGKAREYYQHELYRMSAKAFKITDVDESLTLAIFQKKWLSSSQQPSKDAFKVEGRVIDRYDLTGNNCTTTSVDALKLAGTKVFAAKSLLGADYAEDFTIPSSLERHLSNLASGVDMGVVEVTAAMKQAIQNSQAATPIGSAGVTNGVLGASGYSSGVAGSSSS